MAVSNLDTGRSLRSFLSRIPFQGRSTPPPMPKYPQAVALQDPFNNHPGDCVFSESTFGMKPGGNDRTFNRNNSMSVKEASRINSGFGRPTINTPSLRDPFATSTPTTLARRPSDFQVDVGIDSGVPPTAHPEPTTKHLILSSFIDPLDIAIGSYNPAQPASACRAAPPIGILNSPYGMNGCCDPPSPSDPSYDEDWEERLFDPVPGAGIYAGELIDRGRKPKDWNVVYLSMDWAMGEVVVNALPYNRRGQHVGLHEREGERRVRRADIELRRGFGERWAWNKDEEALDEIKVFCKARLERKAELEWKRECRFAEEVGRFWKARGGGR